MAGAAEMVDEQLEADYFVVGAGAMGMAFVDKLLTESRTATAVLVDRFARPGGHWNVAYDYVQLHLTSVIYGVDSTLLGDGRWGHRANKQEILQYYQDVLDSLIKTGRLQYFPRCEHLGGGRFSSLPCDETNPDPRRTYKVAVRRKTVDATYLRVNAPSMRPPAFPVEGGATVVPPNDLPGLLQRLEPPARFVVIGGGKTGMDAALCLLDHGIAPQSIQWVVPNDPKLMNRDNWWPVVLDPEIPCERMRMRCAFVGTDELGRLKELGPGMVREGRVEKVGATEILLGSGKSMGIQPGTVLVDCTGDGLRRAPALPVFDGQKITLQSVRKCMLAFSAALIAKLEVMYPDDEARKNRLAVVVQNPVTLTDDVIAQQQTDANYSLWDSDSEELRSWRRMTRLDLYGAEALVAREHKEFDLHGWQGYHGRMNGSYVPVGEFGGRPLYRHFSEEGATIHCGRMWHHDGAWRIGIVDFLPRHPELCFAYVKSDAASPVALDAECQWMVHKGTVARRDFGSNEKDFRICPHVKLCRRSTDPTPPSMNAGPAGAPSTSTAPGPGGGGIDPAALMSLAALFASAGGAGGGAPVPANVPGLSQVIEALRSIAPGAGSSAGGLAHEPGAPLLRAVTQPLAAGAGAAADSGIPILGQVGSVVQGILGGITGGLPGDSGYAAQVEQLVDMGFADRDANLRALRASGGSVTVAVNSLV